MRWGDSCTMLWLHALRLRQDTGASVAKDLLRFAQVRPFRLDFSWSLHWGRGADSCTTLQLYALRLCQDTGASVAKNLLCFAQVRPFRSDFS